VTGRTRYGALSPRSDPGIPAWVLKELQFSRRLIPCHDEAMPNTLAAEVYSLAIEYYREDDGRWLADIAALPGVTAYGRTKKQATAAVQALALRLIADRLVHGEALPGPMSVSFIAA